MKMKKKILMAIGALTASLLVGCSKGPEIKYDYNVSEHVKLGQYKGIEVKVKDPELSERDVDTAIKSELLEKNAKTEEVKDRDVVEEGDILNINFKGLLDGVAFEGGSAENYELEIGSGQFIEGFEEQLIGVKVGEDTSLDVRFPDDYSENLAGKDVVFEVKVNSITNKKVYPELTDEFIKENTSFATVDEYRADVKNKLTEKKLEFIENTKQTDAFTAIIENSEIISYPQSKLDQYRVEMNNFYEEYAKSFNVDFDTFLSTYLNLTKEAYDEQVKIVIEDMAKKQLIIEAIAKEEKIKLSNSDLKEGYDKLMKENKVETKEELLNVMRETEIYEYLLMQKVLRFVSKEAAEVK